MRSFGSRTDSLVVDEPLYAFYLRETGMDHPGREEILASQSDDWRRVARELTPSTAGRPSSTRSTCPTTCCPRWSAHGCVR
ncbi:MAG: hypothetical protein P1V35_15765 [Planctomycetota bacterium]|nr:hypothetical protein [Planctomycetota bacterium]